MTTDYNEEAVRGFSGTVPTPRKRLQHLFGGRDVDLFDIQLPDIELTDIAHALAMQCRFGGHTAFHYSVAQHSVYVAARVWDITLREYDTRMALLHDASEAYLLDIPRPLKLIPQFEFYMNLERQVQRRVLKSLGYDGVEDILQTTIDITDNQMLVMEAEQLFTPAFFPLMYGLRKVADWRRTVVQWTPEVAERAFLRAFDDPSILKEVI